MFLIIFGVFSGDKRGQARHCRGLSKRWRELERFYLRTSEIVTVDQLGSESTDGLDNHAHVNFLAQ